MTEDIKVLCKLSLYDILTDVYQSSLGIQEAENVIKQKLSDLIDEASIGAGSCDATEAISEINRGIEDL